MPRPQLLPGLRRLWRGPRTLQLGIDPARAVVLELPDAGLARVLDLLDGTRSERMVITAAARYQLGEPTIRALLDSLCAAGLVVGAQTLMPQNLPAPARRRLAREAAALALRGQDAPATPAQILRRRAAARVVVAGYGQLLAPVSVALAEAGIGHVCPQLTPPPATRRPPAAGPATSREIAETIRRAVPGTRTDRLRRQETSFLVQIGATGPAVLAAAGYARYRLPHLAVTLRDGAAVVGPLVPPAGSPCLNCIDLHRRDRDPQWPLLAAQLADAPAEPEPCPTATGLAAAGLVAGEVLHWLDGTTAHTVGASIEVVAPGELRRRSWPPHPDCHCLPRRGGRAGRRTRAQSGDG